MCHGNPCVILKITLNEGYMFERKRNTKKISLKSHMSSTGGEKDQLTSFNVNTIVDNQWENIWWRYTRMLVCKTIVSFYAVSLLHMKRFEQHQQDVVLQHAVKI